jgi:hypothetical protein
LHAFNPRSFLCSKKEGAPDEKGEKLIRIDQEDRIIKPLRKEGFE